MSISRLLSLASFAVLLAAAGCSRETTAAAAPAPLAAPTPAPDAARPTACGIVTAAAMSHIVGVTLSAAGESGGGTTTCRYRPAERTLPFVEIKIDWGTGRAAMTATGILGRLEPGIAERLAGLGDAASLVGPVLMVRVGEDLVTLTVMGVPDSVATARRFIALMRPRMGPSAQTPPAREDTSGRRTPGAPDHLLRRVAI